MNKVFWTLMAALMLLAGPLCAADVTHEVYFQEDKSPALRFKNISKFDVTIVAPAGDSAGCGVLVYDSTTVSNVVDLSGAGADTITEIGPLFGAATNYKGKAVLLVDANCSLAADSTDDELSDSQTIELQPGDVGVLTWDTSDSKFYSTYIPNSSASFAPNPARKEIESIFGSVGGTGNITVNIYKNGTEVFTDIIVSPVTVSLTNVTDEVSPARLLDYRTFKFGVGEGEDTMIRATRATTGTTGGLGVNVKAKQ